MEKLNERNLQCAKCCYNCKHAQYYEYPECGDELHCMFDVSEEDANFLCEAIFGDEEYDLDRFYNLMGINPESTGIEKSPRCVRLDNICQFYEKENDNMFTYENPYKNMSPEEIDVERQRLLKQIAELEGQLKLRQELEDGIKELERKIAELDDK